MIVYVSWGSSSKLKGDPQNRVACLYVLDRVPRCFLKCIMMWYSPSIFSCCSNFDTSPHLGVHAVGEASTLNFGAHPVGSVEWFK